MYHHCIVSTSLFYYTDTHTHQHHNTCMYEYSLCIFLFVVLQPLWAEHKCFGKVEGQVALHDDGKNYALYGVDIFLITTTKVATRICSSAKLHTKQRSFDIVHLFCFRLVSGFFLDRLCWTSRFFFFVFNKDKLDMHSLHSTLLSFEQHLWQFHQTLRIFAIVKIFTKYFA